MITKKDKLRQWGLPEKFQWHHLRYRDPYEKGVYWYYFSLHVRERDVKKYGTCISCGKPITVETSQAGHFMPAIGCGRDLLFDERNVNAECGPCNAWDATHLLGYADTLDLRYGNGTAMKLRQRKQAYEDSEVPIKDFSKAQYAEMIRKLPNYQKLSTGAAVHIDSVGSKI